MTVTEQQIEEAMRRPDLAEIRRVVEVVLAEREAKQSREIAEAMRRATDMAKAEIARARRIGGITWEMDLAAARRAYEHGMTPRSQVPSNASTDAATEVAPERSVLRSTAVADVFVLASGPVPQGWVSWTEADSLAYLVSPPRPL